MTTTTTTVSMTTTTVSMTTTTVSITTAVTSSSVRSASKLLVFWLKSKRLRVGRARCPWYHTPVLQKNLRFMSHILQRHLPRTICNKNRLLQTIAVSIPFALAQRRFESTSGRFGNPLLRVCCLLQSSEAKTVTRENRCWRAYRLIRHW